MKRTTALLLAGFIAVSGTSHLAAKENSNQNKDKLAMQARMVMKGFMTNLKGTLVGAMKEGGPVHALDVCKKKAILITKEAAAKSGWNIGRTSLKLRNINNKADEWERGVLKDFVAQKAAGADPKKLEHFDIVERDGKKLFRYMKAAPTGKPCLNCHGSELKEEVKAKLAEFYPQDKATGFKLGDIRGAFTLSKELK